MQSSSEFSLNTYIKPAFIEKSIEIANYLKTLDIDQIAEITKSSLNLSTKTRSLYQNWQPKRGTLPAIDAFLGDMYSGLQAHKFNKEDRQYANNHLYILSGLYGVLRALDSVYPYRLEMGYKLPNTRPSDQFSDLHKYWTDSIFEYIDTSRHIINLSVPEYTKSIMPKLVEANNTVKVITPQFLTIKDGEPRARSIVIHSKIARGAYANWIIKNRIEDIDTLKDFNELGYSYNPTLSTETQPVYITNNFQGLGLSIKKTRAVK